MNYLFLSPHLDDAILSCGAYINHLINQELASVTIATIFTGSISSELLSETAKEFHSSCNLGDNAIEVRLEEDKKACTYLGAEYLHIGLLECLYRTTKVADQERLLCSSLRDIFTLNIKQEYQTVNSVQETLNSKIEFEKFDKIYIPLGIGNHIDHLITREVGESFKRKGYEVAGYMEVPYSCLVEKNIYKRYINGLEETKNLLGKNDLEKQKNAILLYSSQIDMLWENKKEMEFQLNEFFSDELSPSVYYFKEYRL